MSAYSQPLWNTILNNDRSQDAPGGTAQAIRSRLTERVPQGPLFQSCRWIRSCRPEAPCSGRNPLLGSNHGRIVISRGLIVLRSLIIRSKSHRGASRVARAGPVYGKALLGSLPAPPLCLCSAERTSGRVFSTTKAKAHGNPPPHEERWINAGWAESRGSDEAHDHDGCAGQTQAGRPPKAAPRAGRAVIANYQTTPESRRLVCHK
jgi:hypothetical protein